MLRSDEAVKGILRDLLAIVAANAPGVIADDDPECLHDFRVALRRTRVLLTQMKEALPPATAVTYKEQFKAIGHLTNPLRDLDVYLLAAPDYQQRVLPALQADLRPFFAYLQTRRAQAYADVVAGLQSAEYATVMAAWSQFLATPTASTTFTPPPLRPLYQTRIAKNHRRICQQGPRLIASPNPADLHILRIHSKKLRYLLEFDAQLFPDAGNGRLIPPLKQMQDNLGRLNDLRIQEQYLLDAAGGISLRGKRRRYTLLAMGNLLATFEAERQQQKSALDETFAAFLAA